MSDGLKLSPKAVQVEGQGGRKINVWDYGGDGPTLLFAHCTGTHARIWDPLVPALSPYFRIIAPDTRGHGDSEQPENPDDYCWANSGDDLLAVMDAFDLPTPIVAAGHSAGGAHIAYAESKRSGTFSNVVLIDPIIGPKEFFGGDNPLAAVSRRRRNTFESKQAALDRYSSRPPLNTWHPAALEAYVEHGFYEKEDGSAELKCPGHVEALVYERSGSTDVYEHLSELKFTVTLVTSEDSNVKMLAEIQSKGYTNLKEFIILKECSHFIPQEKPDEVAAIILKALA